jgi:hypothetical protein
MNRSDFRWNLVYPLLSRISSNAGCYAIYIGGSLVYIGQSGNLRLRFRRWGFCKRELDYFITPWGDVRVGDLKVKVAYSRKFGDWVMRELRLIRRLRPKFNKILYGDTEDSNG